MVRYSVLSTRYSALIALLTLSAVTARGIAQDDRPSHVPVPRTTDADPAKLFQERIQQSRERTDLGSLLKQFGAGGPFGNPEQIRKLLEANPQLRDMARKMANDLADGDPETRERLRGLIGSVLQSNPDLSRRYGLTPEAVEEKLKSLGRQGPPGDLVEPPARPSRPRTSPPPPRPEERPADRPPPDPAEQAARRQWAERVAEWADRFPHDRLGPLQNSPAVKDLFRHLSEAAADAVRGGGGAEGLDAQLARWEARWQAARDWLPQELPAALRSLKLPDLSRLPRPNLHVPHLEVSPPTISAPQFGGPGFSLGTAANVVLVIFGVVILLAVAWRVRSGGLAAGDATGRPPGPWPLDPARVATREELIRAFEYLTLLRCGEPARAWHHRAIAACLGGAEAERRAAAERLAELYEQARYAPAAGGEPDWSSARGPLGVLAGAG